MNTATKEVFDFLRSHFGDGRIKDIICTFESCSMDDANRRALVESKTKTLNFDTMTRWFYKGKQAPKSADTMSFSSAYIYLIEFKSGNQVKNNNKEKDLIKNVMGKINDSDHTIYQFIIPFISSQTQESIKLRFYLVVDSKEMGISPLVTALAKLSQPAIKQNPMIKPLFDSVLPNLKNGIAEAEHFNKVDIWYSDIFDQYLSVHGIKDISLFEK